jgi:hypothetical protein
VHTTPGSVAPRLWLEQAMAKSSCSTTCSGFVENAAPVEVVVNGIPMTAEAKEFSTGLLSWYLTGKTNLKAGEKAVSVQIGTTLATVASRELPMKKIRANS